MGLIISHGAYEGTSKCFNDLRRFQLAAIGGSYSPHENPKYKEGYWYWDEEEQYSSEKNPALREYFCLPDDEGEIGPIVAFLIAKDLEGILPKIEEKEKLEGVKIDTIANRGGYVEMTKTIIESFKEAYNKKEKIILR